MNKSTVLLLTCLVTCSASQAGAQTVSPAFDAWLKARRDAHARLLVAPPSTPVVTQGLAVPYTPSTARAPAAPTATSSLADAPVVVAPEPSPARAPSAPVPQCVIATAPPAAPTPAPAAPLPPTPVQPPVDPRPSVARATPRAAATPKAKPAPIPATPVAAPASAPAPIMSARPAQFAPYVGAAAPVQRAAPEPVRYATDASGIPTRDYDVAALPRATTPSAGMATGSVMDQYLKLSLRYQ